MSLLSNVLSWLIFGTVIGGIAYIIEPKFRNIKPFVLGIIGAVLAGIISNMIFNIPLYQLSFVYLTMFASNHKWYFQIAFTYIQ